MALRIFEIDPSLTSCQEQIWERVNGYRHFKNEFTKTEGGLEKFAEGYRIFGFNRTDGGYTFREWLPNAKQVFLTGEFNEWQNTCPLESEGFGRWCVFLADKADGSLLISHKTQLKVRIETNEGEWIERVPAWAKLAWQDAGTNLFNGVFWEPPADERYTFAHAHPVKPNNLKIYEAHVGMSSVEPKVATYSEFAEDVLPRIKRMGYNAVQLMAVAEHAHYGCFGYHVTSFFAPSSRSGTPEELKKLVDTAHGLGIVVLMDLVHAHASSNSLDGIAAMDGTDYCYTHGGAKGHHAEWDSKIFNYSKHEVMRYLLSNIRWWLEEYQFDGFRFDGITSMLYQSHGIGKGYTGGYHEYFGPDADIDSHIYLMLANDLIHTILPSAITVGEDVSGMPTLCRPVVDGGFGFDYRLAMAVPDMFIKLLKEVGDDNWDMGHIVHTLTNRRWMEKCVAYAESHDQAIVGDKSIAFWLMDAEMYTGMSLHTTPCPSMCVDRGLALHKMIRLLVLGLGGEGYLNFIGNEFGHPEWVDFPRPENGWSHHHCRRRWDLAEDPLLRYKFFQEFDELMNACENRFTWLEAEHQYVTVKNEGDKVIAFERGDLLFVFNLHPCNSYSDYSIGMNWNEAMRCILDTDEGRFGGHHRLDWGHANTFPPQVGTHGRPHSIKIYLPSRTAQVFIKDRLLKGGISLQLADDFLTYHKVAASEVRLELEISADGKEISTFEFDADGCMQLASHNCGNFRLKLKRGKDLACVASKDGLYRIYFPGKYKIGGVGYVKPEIDASPSAAVLAQETLGSSETNGKAKNELEAPVEENGKVKVVAENKVDIKDKPSEGKSSAPDSKASAKERKVEAQPMPITKTTEESKTDVIAEQKSSSPDSSNTATDSMAKWPSMSRWPSGLHILGDLEHEDFSRQVSEPAEDGKARLEDYETAMKNLGGSLNEFASSYKTHGLQKMSDGTWFFREWIPDASSVALVGDFNNWDCDATPLQQSDTTPDFWIAPIASDIKKGSKYKLFIHPKTGDPYYAMSAWSTRYVFTPETRLFDALVWPLETAPPRHRAAPPSGDGLRIYECHLGMLGDTGGFAGAAASLLPRVLRDGYNTILLVGVQECKEYSSMGTQPLNLFAPAHCLGTPEELRDFVNEVHKQGLRVLLSLPHDGAASCEDGIPGQFFLPEKGFHPRNGSRLYDYAATEVLRYLLSNLAYWMEEFAIDGFRFQGVSSMIYLDHGRFLPDDPKEFDDFLASENKTNKASLRYLMMANSLIHGLYSFAPTVADELTLFPGVCEPIARGGLGFDLRQSPKTSNVLHDLLSRCRDEEWNMSSLASTVSRLHDTRVGEKVLSYTESSEECTVGRRPLRIAMLAWETLHTIAAGGVAPHVTELSGALHAAGHDVHIFTRSTQPRTWENKIWGVTYHEVAYDLHSDFIREMSNMCGAFVAELCSYEGREGPFDIIHGHDWLVGVAVCQLKSAFGKRVVYTMHSTETGRCGNIAYDGPSARIRAIEGEACHSADRVIAVSGVLKEEVCSHYAVDGRKIPVIYNGIHAESIVNMEWQDDWSGNTKRDKGFDVMAPMFLFVGRLAVQKGPDLLIEAIPFILQARGDAKFVIVGDGHMKAALEGRVHQLGIGHAVCFAGSVKSGSSHLKSLFKSCDAVIVPSRNEPFGIVVLEAWAAGKPVVATTCGGPRDFVLPDKDGYLVDPDPGSIAWGVCKICENFTHAKWMGSRAQAKALREFNWSFIARQTEKIYYEQMCLHEAPFRQCSLAGAPLAAKLLAPHRDRMGVLDDDILVARGMSMLKQLRLLVASLGSNATLTWMGSEFGQPDAFDMPRASNSYSSSYARFDLADDKGLKFKHLEMFEMHVNYTESILKWLALPPANILVQDEEAKVLVYSRNRCVFAFNFHPSISQSSYSIAIPSPLGVVEDLIVVLDTEDARFGGRAPANVVSEMDKTLLRLENSTLSIKLSPRQALVLAPCSCLPALKMEKALALKTVDEFVDVLKQTS